MSDINDVTMMFIKHLLTVNEALMNENRQLKAELLILTSALKNKEECHSSLSQISEEPISLLKYQELKDDHEKQRVKNKQLKSKISELEVLIEEKDEVIKSKEEKIETRDDWIETRDDRIKSRDKELEKWEAKFSAIAWREIMKVLEEYIVLDVLGSASSIRKYKVYNLRQMRESDDKIVQDKFEESKWSDDKDLLDAIEHYTHVGDMVINDHNSSVYMLRKSILDCKEDNTLLNKVIELLEEFRKTYNKPFGQTPFLKLPLPGGRKNE